MQGRERSVEKGSQQVVGPSVTNDSCSKATFPLLDTCSTLLARGRDMTAGTCFHSQASKCHNSKFYLLPHRASQIPHKTSNISALHFYKFLILYLDFHYYIVQHFYVFPSKLIYGFSNRYTEQNSWRRDFSTRSYLKPQGLRPGC